MVNIVKYPALIEERKQSDAYARNRALLEKAYAVAADSAETWAGTKWLCGQVPQMASWLGLVPKGLDYLALEAVYLSDDAISIAEPTLEDGEIIGDRFREWLNYNECSVFMQHRRNLVIPMLKECSGKVVSMASGSALVETVALAGSNVELICVDKNPDALHRAQDFAAKVGMSVKTLHTDLLALNIAELQPNVIYSIGFLGNYLTSKQITGMLAQWLPALKSGGKLITDFINLDAEAERCLTKIVGWPIARTADTVGLRVYTPGEFFGIIESALLMLGIGADVHIADYQYGGIATITVL